MEKPGCVRQGLVRLPPGFRFHPTDEELVVQYLKRKVFCCPLPASIIPEIGLSKYDPWDLPGCPESERYFFNIREVKYPNGSRPNRASASGFWKTTGKDRPVVASRTNQVVGMKKALVFYRGRAPNGCKTDWIMHEYRLAGTGSEACLFPQRKNSTLSSVVRTEDWVLCRVFKKRRPAKVPAGEEFGGFIDFLGRRGAESGGEPESEPSCVTEACDEDSAGSEASSSQSPGET